MNKAILYYSHNSLPIEMENYFQRALVHSSKGIPITAAVSLNRNPYSSAFAHTNLPHFDPSVKGWANILDNMGRGLQSIISQFGNVTVYLAEHDVLYSPSYFELEPPDDRTILKNFNLYMMNRQGFFGPHNSWIHSQTIANAQLLLECIREQCVNIERFKTQKGYRLMKTNSPQCCIDVRHGYNYTGYREPSTKKYLHELPFWGTHADLALQIPNFSS